MEFLETKPKWAKRAHITICPKVLSYILFHYLIVTALTKSYIIHFLSTQVICRKKNTQIGANHANLMIILAIFLQFSYLRAVTANVLNLSTSKKCTSIAEGTLKRNNAFVLLTKKKDMWLKILKI